MILECLVHQDVPPTTGFLTGVSANRSAAPANGQGPGDEIGYFPITSSDPCAAWMIVKDRNSWQMTNFSQLRFAPDL